MSCNKISNRCGDTNYAPCIVYQGDIPTYSSLTEQECVNIEDTTEDTYNFITDIKGQINLSELGEGCLSYVTDEEGRVVVKNVLLKYEEEICALKTKIQELETTAICDRDITQCGIDLEGLTDQCNEPINTLGQLLSFLVEQHITTP